MRKKLFDFSPLERGLTPRHTWKHSCLISIFHDKFWTPVNPIIFAPQGFKRRGHFNLLQVRAWANGIGNKWFPPFGENCTKTEAKSAIKLVNKGIFCVWPLKFGSFKLLSCVFAALHFCFIQGTMQGHGCVAEGMKAHEVIPTNICVVLFNFLTKDWPVISSKTLPSLWQTRTKPMYFPERHRLEARSSHLNTGWARVPGLQPS